MEAKSTDKKTFQLTDNGQQLGELHYESLFSHKAQIKLTNADTYDIKPVGVFGTSITVTKNGTEIANLKMNWRGQIVFTFQDGQEFLFKAKGAFLNKYTIDNKDGENEILLDPKFEWSKFNYSYNISYDKKPQDILFVLLSVYASNYFIASMSGVIAGTA
ncbi:MAG: hypothetical protein QY303_05185 [Vicingaceae bacterium]|nr:MAG: hypothetical protein QY303_04780 [Vicingaceae bacterium]WKZ76263.1 MAG: hypothetical protein QY303_05060 [Vicingaceae bacterium]WKZ76275.1 MAG: hypothetical protein QY303_05120 [Vicingaceae bacterium]WKZ76283.1 MAG: hypothetical protein QY303_05160 [Vicingaceae bacterium]WKZ76288.1 MAG: hypothetical protein QY303_05185 [Vicingaceae bacterium]